MSSAERMTRSDSRNPAAGAGSSPGVLMMTAKDRPWSRMSSGSSAAATSELRVTASPATRVTGTLRVGLSPGGIGGSDMTLGSRGISPDARQERRPRPWIFEANLVFDREVWQCRAEGVCEQTDARRGHNAGLVMNVDIVQTTARRLRFDDVAREIGRGQLAETARGIVAHAIRVIRPCVDRNHADPCV